MRTGQELQAEERAAYVAMGCDPAAWSAHIIDGDEELICAAGVEAVLAATNGADGRLNGMARLAARLIRRTEALVASRVAVTVAVATAQSAVKARDESDHALQATTEKLARAEHTADFVKVERQDRDRQIDELLRERTALREAIVDRDARLRKIRRDHAAESWRSLDRRCRAKRQAATDLAVRLSADLVACLADDGRAEGDLAALCRRTWGKSDGRLIVTIVPGQRRARVTLQAGQYRTPGGKLVRHPNAYSKKGRCHYVAGTYLLEVGAAQVQKAIDEVM
jgi:hypothetical protein